MERIQQLPRPFDVLDDLAGDHELRGLDTQLDELVDVRGIGPVRLESGIPRSVDADLIEVEPDEAGRHRREATMEPDGIGPELFDRRPGLAGEPDVDHRTTGGELLGHDV